MADTPRALPVLTDLEIRKIFADQMSLPLSDGEIVGLDDAVPFACARSGNCCTGRHGYSNLMLPTEVAGGYAWLRQEGLVTSVDDMVPRLVARVAAVTKTHPAWAKRKKTFTKGDQSGISVGDTGVHFLGMAFVMQPDPRMPDGDRCIFLRGDTPGAFACGLHGTRAQPMQCALAPLGALPGVSDVDPPRFIYPLSRQRWCTGMREAMAGRRPSTTARAILEANFGADRLAELRTVHEARVATERWTRGYQNHHSPLAQLYIAALPELRPLLVGY